jgi:hypothetical protein
VYYFPLPNELCPGEKLCLVYEMYVGMVESPLIRFEHAALLATALAEAKEIFLQFCLHRM